MRMVQSEEEVDWMGQDCWFCRQRQPVRGASSMVKLKKFADGAGSNVRVLHCSVAVPRCAECAAGHKRGISKAVNVALGGALLVFLVVVVWNPIAMPGWMKALLVVGGLVPGATMIGGTAGLPAGQKPESHAKEFVAVEHLRREGWMDDDQP